MKNALVVLTGLTGLLLFSCNGQPEADASGASVIQLDTAPPFDTIMQTRPKEVYYGIDTALEYDSVIYEQDGKILTFGVINGTFHHMDRDHFMYYTIADSNGLLHRFFVNTENQRQMDKYYEGYEPARGHPVQVKWERGSLPIREGGGMMTVYQAKAIIE